MAASRSGADITDTSDRPAPECRKWYARPHEIVFRQSFEAETMAVDEVNRNQTGCGRNRSVAGSSASVAKAPGSRRRDGGDRWHASGNERSADGEGPAPLIFQRSCGNVTPTIEIP